MRHSKQERRDDELTSEAGQLWTGRSRLGQALAQLNDAFPALPGVDKSRVLGGNCGGCHICNVLKTVLKKSLCVN